MEYAERIALIGRILARLRSLSEADRFSLLTRAGIDSSWIQHFGDRLPDLLLPLDDPVHVALHELLEGFPYASFDPSTEGWAWGRFRVFMSHRAENKTYVHEVADALHPHAVTTFVAHDDIAPTVEWQGEIEKHLRHCDALVAFLFPGFETSSWTDQEVGYCLFRQVLIVPIRMGLDPYGFMGRFQGFPGLNQPASSVAAGLLEIFKASPKARSSMGTALLHHLSESPSYDEARSRWSSLSQTMSDWSPESLAILETAVTANDQISHANHGNLGPEIMRFITSKRAELGVP